ncbi:MAG: hypothetical protein ABJ360_00640 [Roseobacter sp.]
MKLSLKNIYYDDSPISVELQLEPADQEGWHQFSLRLFAGAKVPVIECRGAMTNLDVEKLSNKLRAACEDEAVPMEFSPLEPWFTVRTSQLSQSEVECTWIVDHGMATGKASTETGIAVLLILTKDQLLKNIEGFC